jgi:hypothetical protein
MRYSPLYSEAGHQSQNNNYKFPAKKNNNFLTLINDAYCENLTASKSGDGIARVTPAPEHTCRLREMDQFL